MGVFKACEVSANSYLQNLISNIRPDNADAAEKWGEIRGSARAFRMSNLIDDMQARHYGSLCQKRLDEIYRKLPTRLRSQI